MSDRYWDDVIRHVLNQHWASPAVKSSEAQFIRFLHQAPHCLTSKAERARSFKTFVQVHVDEEDTLYLTANGVDRVLNHSSE